MKDLENKILAHMQKEKFASATYKFIEYVKDGEKDD